MTRGTEDFTPNARGILPELMKKVGLAGVAEGPEGAPLGDDSGYIAENLDLALEDFPHINVRRP